jgi:serine protease AprX
MNAAKLHSSLAAAITADTYQKAGMPIIVKVRRGYVARGEMQALATIESECDFHLVDARAMTATPDMIAALTEDPAVELIWPDLPVHTWLADAVPLVHAPRVWESGFTGSGVKIAVLDTGIDAAHGDFEGRIVAYKDFVNPNADGEDTPQDPNGHGTHVAGIAAGSGVVGEGRWRGVAPDAELVIGRVLDAAGNGRTSQVMAGIEWAVEQGAQVINVSLGGPPTPADGTDALSVLCDAAVDRGVVICAAAGNLGPAHSTVGAPGASARVITIGAAETDPARQDAVVASFSSRGPTGDGRVKPDLVFPGVSLVAPRAAGTSLGRPVNEHYTSVSGTSQATPMATGTAALLLQANPRLTPEEIKSRMVRGAHRLPDAEPVVQGAGLGDSYNTFISAVGDPLTGPRTPTPADPPRVPAPQPAGCLAAAISGLLIR